MITPVEVREVSRWYGDVVALHRVSFDVGPGVTGLLGPNGAGKTSLLRALVGLHPVDGGTVRVLGRDPRRDPAVHRHLGYVPAATGLPDALRAHPFVATLAERRGAAEPVRAAAAALRTAGLDPDDRRPLRVYSKGMRQRVKLAAALAHDPQVLLLDEPLDGLDPTGRREVSALLQDLGAAGRTVVVSSHVLHEVQRIAPRVVVLVAGRIAAEGTPREIRALLDDRPLRIRIATDEPRSLAAVLLGDGLVAGAHVEGPTDLVVDVAAAGEFHDRLAGAALDAAAVLHEVVPLDEDLDSVFGYLVDRS